MRIHIVFGLSAGIYKYQLKMISELNAVNDKTLQRLSSNITHSPLMQVTSVSFTAFLNAKME